jgi:hypothetical protein
MPRGRRNPFKKLDAGGGHEHFRDVKGKPKDAWWTPKQKSSVDVARDAAVRQKAVMIWVANLSAKDNRALILKNFILAWARVAQFEHIRRTGLVGGGHKPIHPDAEERYAVFACDCYQVKEDKITHLVAEPRFVVQRRPDAIGKPRTVGALPAIKRKEQDAGRKIHDEEPYWMGLAAVKPTKDLLHVTMDEIDDVLNPRFYENRNHLHNMNALARSASMA